MNRVEEVPVWKPKRETRIDLPELSFMHGGPNGMHLPEHEHTEVQVGMYFLAQRDGSHRVPGALPGFLKLIPSGKPHVGRWQHGEEVVVVLLGREFVAKAADELLQQSSSEILETECAVDPILQAIGATLRREFLSGGTADEAYLAAVGTVLSGHLVRRWSSLPGERSTRGKLTPRQLRATIEAMEESGKTSVSALAGAIGLGPHRFTRLFRRATGHSPYQFLVQRRLQKACDLLQDTQMPLVQIALQVGFASQSHFTSVFRDRFRSTPLRFRQERQRSRKSDGDPLS